MQIPVREDCFFPLESPVKEFPFLVIDPLTRFFLLNFHKSLQLSTVQPRLCIQPYHKSSFSVSSYGIWFFIILKAATTMEAIISFLSWNIICTTAASLMTGLFSW